MASQNLFEHPEVCCQSSPKVPKVNIPRMPQNFFLNLVNPNQIWILITIFRHKFGMEQQDSEKISVCVYNASLPGWEASSLEEWIMIQRNQHWIFSNQTKFGPCPS